MVWRQTLAFVLCALVLVVWIALFPNAPPRPAAVPGPVPARPGEAPPAANGVVPPTGPAVSGPAVPPAGPAAQPPAPGPGGTPPLGPPSRAVIPRNHQEVRVSAGSKLEYIADSRDGVLQRAFLPEYHEAIDQKDPYLLLYPPLRSPAALGLEFEGLEAIPPGEEWDLEEVKAEGKPSTIILRNKVEDVEITKTLVPPGEVKAGAAGFDVQGPVGPRILRVRVAFQNTGNAEKQFSYRIAGGSGIDTESLQAPGSDLELACGTWVQGDLVQVEIFNAAKLASQSSQWSRTERIAWVGLSSSYFTSIFFPVGAGAVLRVGFLEKAYAEAIPDAQQVEQLAGRPISVLGAQELSDLSAKAFKNLRMGFRSHRIILKPGAREEHDFGLYLGPRESRELAEYSNLNFVGVNQYGTFGILVKLFIWLLGCLKYIAFGSWGFAIMLLTFVVKLCLHPINKRSQGGMQRFQKKMAKIKPQMDEIKARFEKDRVRQNVEIQKLWKENKINPGQQMLGCMIIFLQLPIWWGLYSTLQYAPGLRQAAFLYIKDITRPDNLFSFGFSLPFIGEYFNLLPVLYVILTIANQRMQPKPEDPQMLAQYNMMSFMMVFFGFLFYKSPAGFMLYIMTSAGLGILESKIIKAELRWEEERGEDSNGKGASRKGPASTALYPARARRPEDEKGRRR